MPKNNEDHLELDGVYFDMDSAWEIRGIKKDQRAICRWSFVYQYLRDEADEIMEDEEGRPFIVGVAAGFAGGGTFMLERFCVVGDHPDNLSQLYLEGGFNLKAEKTPSPKRESWENLDGRILEAAEKAYQVFLKWVDDEAWQNQNELLLKASMWTDSNVSKDGDMLYVLTDDDNIWTLAVGEALGLTARRDIVED